MSDEQPTTLDELKRYLARIGQDPDGVAPADVPGVPRIDGMSLIRRLPDGQYEVVGWERGIEYDAKRYPSEAAAVQAVVGFYAHPSPVSGVRTPEERRADSERMRVRAKETLQRIAEAQKREGTS